jgi:hypothetical protein
MKVRMIGSIREKNASTATVNDIRSSETMKPA